MRPLDDPFVDLVSDFINQVIEKDKRKYWFISKICNEVYGRGALVFTIHPNTSYLEYGTMELLSRANTGKKITQVRNVRCFEAVIVFPGVFACEVITWLSDAVMLIFSYLGDVLGERYNPPRLINPTDLKLDNLCTDSTVINVGGRKQL